MSITRNVNTEKKLISGPKVARISVLASQEDILDQLISGPKVADFLDLDPATIRRYKREGCPAHLIGEGLVRYRLSEVLAWRAKRCARK
jgi:predicted DNA-binding transcriptional regulator AlpA